MAAVTLAAEDAGIDRKPGKRKGFCLTKNMKRYINKQNKSYSLWMRTKARGEDATEQRQAFYEAQDKVWEQQAIEKQRRLAKKAASAAEAMASP